MVTVADEIGFKIHDSGAQFIDIALDPGESVVAEAGAMLCMDNGIEMQTIMGDGSDKEENNNFISNLFRTGKRYVSGAGVFMTVFTNVANKVQNVAFAAPYPGRIVPMDLKQHSGTLLCQKDAFLCAAKGVSIDMAYQKKIMAALFGGEGFVLQKLEGDGLVFFHAGGSIIQRILAPGEIIKIDTGCVVAFEPSVDFDITMVKGVKSMMFGGEGVYLAKLTGPGKVWLQSMPFSHLAGEISRRILPQK